MARAESEAVPVLLRLLADETRWRLVGALRHGDGQVSDLAEQLSLPHNLVSYHLGVLRQAGLAVLHRSEADGRVQYYGLDRVALQRAFEQLGARLPRLIAPPADLPSATVLFLSFHNRVRSQLAEAWLRHLSQGRIVARSAGIVPDALHPLAVQAMAEAGIDIGYQQAKGLDAVRALHADVLVTLCDRSREQGRDQLRAPVQLHWSLPDPARIAGDADADALPAIRAVRDQLRARVQGLLATLPDLVMRQAHPGHES